MGELKNFERELEKHFDGGCQAHPFQKKWHLLAMKFRKDLADSRPVLVFPILRTPSQPSQSNGDGSIPGTPTPFRGNTTPIPIDSDDDDPSPISQRSGQKRPFCLIKQSPKKMARTITDTAPSAKQATSKRFDLFEVRNIIQDAYIGLPNQTDPKATERMIILSSKSYFRATPLKLS